MFVVVEASAGFGKIVGWSAFAAGARLGLSSGAMSSGFDLTGCGMVGLFFSLVNLKKSRVTNPIDMLIDLAARLTYLRAKSLCQNGRNSSPTRITVVPSEGLNKCLHLGYDLLTFRLHLIVNLHIAPTARLQLRLISVLYR